MNNIFEFFSKNNTDPLWLYWTKDTILALLIFIGFWILAKIVRHLLNLLGPKIVSIVKINFDNDSFKKITAPIYLLIIFIGIYLGIESFSLPTKASTTISGISYIITVCILANICYRIIHEIFAWYLKKIEDCDGIIDRQVVPIVETTIAIFLAGIAVIVIMKHFDKDIFSLITAFGIGSLAIGMAAKETLGNMMSGLTIILDRPFRIGDRIQLTTGQSGDVVDIGIRSTKIRAVDNTFIIIPNSDLCNRIVVNQAYPDTKSQGRVVLGIEYGNDVEKAKSVMLNAVAEIHEVLSDPPAAVFFTAFNDSSLQMTLLFWVDNYRTLFAITDKVNSLLIKRLPENGINMPFPTRTLYIHKEP
ncbi:MAG: mechanosensitive ion channel [Desulfuromonadales bacterium]|nr:mechanosensitive ion channel [Desulfuromonadales bacterium]